jgi:hypothetical protein
VLLGGATRSSGIPATLAASGMAITLLSVRLLTKRRLRVLLLALSLDSCIGSTAIASLRVSTVLELVVALLESSTASEPLLLVVASLAITLLAVAGSICTKRSIAHTAISTAIGVGSTETSISASVSTASKATTVVTETTTADVGVTANRHSTGACHVGRLHALGSRDNVVLDILTLGKTLKASIVVDGGVMDKDLVYWGGLRAL